ncbi:FliM/FliN family flagellar motor switch protein [Trinickia diaoshuihuensis]|uniref:FliM/FliN family flagellar motor switch protein n=1 Tax=Trinickia diaoshuihuensis TaxID=2292265 RepID=UPI0013C2A799|nr:FliM/FliN family flagellar motor switch protein [Trinickia diaoshuihuensis]
MTKADDPGTSRLTQPCRRPLRLRAVDALAKARHRLASAYSASCRLDDGEQAQLLLHTCFRPDGEGLPLATRFGYAIAYDYGPLLLACTGIDTAQAATLPGQAALACYAFAALPPELQAALGDPTAIDAAPAGSAFEPHLSIGLSIRLQSVRLSMRLTMTADGLHALLDSEPWVPVVPVAHVPAWIKRHDTQIGLTAGDAVLPLPVFERLACGDIVRLSRSVFDVTGRASIRIASHRLRLRWLDSHHCFEVEDMTHTPTPPHDEAYDAVPRADDALPSIDPAALPIRLSFLLGTLRLTVGELARVRPGSLLQLRERVPPRVIVEANGQAIGEGELVDFDGRLAVEITRWPDSRPTATTP